MKAYVEAKMGDNLTVLPFQGGILSDLKRQFGTCAGSETSALGMTAAQRKNGIPTLIVIDNKTGEPLDDEINFDALTDVSNLKGIKALEKWEESLE